MKEDRLKQIERHVCEEMSSGCFGCIGLNELIAEIRRLRVNLGEARGMVDALLAAYLEGDYENGWEWDRVRQMRDWVE